MKDFNLKESVMFILQRNQEMLEKAKTPEEVLWVTEELVHNITTAVREWVK
jgi:hypothetical protein